MNLGFLKLTEGDVPFEIIATLGGSKIAFEL